MIIFITYTFLPPSYDYAEGRHVPSDDDDGDDNDDDNGDDDDGDGDGDDVIRISDASESRLTAVHCSGSRLYFHCKIEIWNKCKSLTCFNWFLFRKLLNNLFFFHFDKIVFVSLLGGTMPTIICLFKAYPRARQVSTYC